MAKEGLDLCYFQSKGMFTAGMKINSLKAADWTNICNLRSPQQHVGVVHSSNLCTEITLNTNSETAVCNLGSVNLPAHLKNGVIDHEKLRRTVRTAMRMLDNC